MMLLLLINVEFMIYMLWMLLGVCWWWKSMKLIVIYAITKNALNCGGLW